MGGCEYLFFMENSFNRTVKELKCTFKVAIKHGRFSFNRTVKELKFENPYIVAGSSFLLIVP